MARLTASDMVDMVRDCLGGETTETISDIRILRYVNQSYLQVASKVKFDQLSATPITITTSSGTTSYELSASDVSRINDLEDDTNNHKMYPMNEDQYRKFTQGSSSSGTPIYWFIDGVGANNRFNLTLWPTPAGTYTINVYYNKKPTELVTSPTATSTVIPEAWDDSIVSRATSRGWRMLGDLGVAKEWLSFSKENDRDAMAVTHHPSYIITSPGSVIGRALQDV
ncbi:hypothetical protein LCGC14_0344890 [marine sediment metagenome]|uniref:Uncharacterized protein n=1 Tax=marine sediment metagenome TaxID=412755 RepID=A0A0F9WKJ8_9ZZZZ